MEYFDAGSILMENAKRAHLYFPISVVFSVTNQWNAPAAAAVATDMGHIVFKMNISTFTYQPWTGCKKTEWKTAKKPTHPNEM